MKLNVVLVRSPGGSGTIQRLRICFAAPKTIEDPSFDALKVGDQVTLKVEELNGVRQVTQFAK